MPNAKPLVLPGSVSKAKRSFFASKRCWCGNAKHPAPSHILHQVATIQATEPTVNTSAAT